MRFSIGWIALFLAFNALAAGPQPSIESVEGDGAFLRAADGTEQELKVGDTAAYGETIEVKPGGAARVAFDNGAQAILGSGSKAALYEETTTTGSDGDSGPTPGLDLHNGTARFLVAPAKGKAPATPPVKFWVRSRATTMGVRGTDFVVHVKDGETQLHTIKGRVELGHNAAAMRDNDGIAVTAETYHEATVGKPLDTLARRFAPTGYLAQLQREEPNIEKIYKVADSQSETERLRKKFEALHIATPAAAATPEAEPSPDPSASPSPLAEGVDHMEFSGKKPVKPLVAPSAKPVGKSR